MGGGVFLLIYFYKFYYDSNICSWFKKKKNISNILIQKCERGTISLLPIIYDTAVVLSQRPCVPLQCCLLVDSHMILWLALSSIRSCYLLISLC